MDSLRISLIVIGIVIIVLLYFGSRFFQKESKSQAESREMPSFEEPSNSEQLGDVAHSVEEPSAAISASTIEKHDLPVVEDVEPPEAMVVKDENSEIESVDKQPETAGVPAVIALHIIAKKDDFSGAALVKSANLAAMRYGEMGIFHFLGATTGDITFSMANMLEPGTFDMEKLNEFTTPGVLLFMESELQNDLAKSLDSMAKVAQSISGSLNGQLCDERRKPFEIKDLPAWKSHLLGSQPQN